MLYAMDTAVSYIVCSVLPHGCAMNTGALYIYCMLCIVVCFVLRALLLVLNFAVSTVALFNELCCFICCML